ncbi:MAG: Hsp20/alpha crystallin family protein [Deferribacterales bacterium]|jgi:HSP20 family protein|uniref:Hsp20/alpha crystallin family protein n=1 Tax=Deferrivibrio essentukiensis TaxID=2880922 RepID=UPI001989931B|nr:Hsp20/alpha crystallin family protein [Deferrivibrio essentukiensis]MBC7196004.1 Hsp20/alpha crystallin family protein [Deferribacterales bacterium]MBZ4672047.1 heat shock protein Hsp20 [Deferribacteraceae bacterium]MCB4205047.1 Hsp20/alpha crystallin family protein [Deferrivibrio essentukiensis]
MAIVRWDPFKDIMSLQERINKIFDETVQQDRKSQYGDWYPPVDIFEKEDGITIIMEIPGVSENDIDLQITDGVLTVRGEKKLPYEKSNENFYRLERNFGKFARSFSLPNTVDQNKVKAGLKEGILKIEIGKKDEIKPKVIKVEKED